MTTGLIHAHACQLSFRCATGSFCTSRVHTTAHLHGRYIDFTGTEGLNMRPNSHLTIDCSFNEFNTYSRFGKFMLPEYGFLELHNCYVDNFKGRADADESLSLKDPDPNLPFGGSGASGGVLIAIDSALRWHNGVRTCLSNERFSAMPGMAYMSAPPA